jgi:NAD(P)-dependent dehydrogenase (short-subunit alcohol dehydrogenase family)
MDDARVALVTGSARGLGREVAERFAQDGMLVHVVHRSPQGRDALIDRFGVDRVHTADLTCAGSADRLIEDVLTVDGQLDTLVHAVGAYHLKPVSETSIDEAREMVESNWLSAMALVEAARTSLRATGGSVVCFGCAGIESLRARRSAPAYVAAKTALLVWARSVALEEAPHGVRVNVVSPGVVPHPHASEDTLDPELQARIPAGRPGRPEEIAGVVAWLTSHAAAHVTGQNLDVAGGWML